VFNDLFIYHTEYIHNNNNIIFGQEVYLPFMRQQQHLTTILLYLLLYW